MKPTKPVNATGNKGAPKAPKLKRKSIGGGERRQSEDIEEYEERTYGDGSDSIRLRSGS